MSAGGGTGGRRRDSSSGGSGSGGNLPGTVGGDPIPLTDSPFPIAVDSDRSSQTGGSTLGAALLNLDTQESAPGGAGGLDLYARQQREINRLKSRVAVVEQVLVV
jgi:hypothetical protein